MSNNFNDIDLFWNLSNYLSVNLMYIKHIDKKVNSNNIDQNIRGHWGNVAIINLIYSHLNKYIKEKNRKIQLVVGTGHAGIPLIINSFLEGTLQEYYNSDYTQFDKLKQFTLKYRSEINPNYPGTIYDGGELGYAMAVAYGASINNENIIFCIIGDGELETGTTSSMLWAKDLFKYQKGFVVTLINLNGFKMGNRSIISSYSDEMIEKIFKNYGFSVKIVYANHEGMINMFQWIDELYQSTINSKTRKYPLVILKSPKGLTAPCYKCIEIEGRMISHKNPIGDMDKEIKIEYLQYWLDSYNIKFSDQNIDSILNKIIPIKPYRIGERLNDYSLKIIKLPEVSEFYLNKFDEMYSNVSILDKYLLKIIETNKRNFYVVSPDELLSNKMLTLYNEKKNNVIEVLNENICQAIMQGIIVTGKTCIMISYEAFYPIITSMVLQYLKWVKQCQKINWRMKLPPAIYVSTSVCWENTYSHQNPIFINTLIDSEYENIRVYFPINANSLLSVFSKSMSNKNSINLIISSKQLLPQWTNYVGLNEKINDDIIELECNSDSDSIDIVFVAIGDVALNELYNSIRILEKLNNNIKYKLIALTEITRLGSNNIYDNGMTDTEFKKLFPEKASIIISFHGYSSAIYSILKERITFNDIHVLGYKNNSTSSVSSLEKVINNKASRFDIAKLSIEILLNKKIISKDKSVKLLDTIKKIQILYDKNNKF